MRKISLMAYCFTKRIIFAMYQSKKTVRGEFESFRNVFLLSGGVLCFVVGLVGVLNFFNAVFTGILSRQREFAMLQAVGMTGKQLKRMLGILLPLAVYHFTAKKSVVERLRENE